MPSEAEAQTAAKGKSVALGDYNDPNVARAFPVQYRTISGMQERVEEIDRASGRYDELVAAKAAEKRKWDRKALMDREFGERLAEQEQIGKRARAE